MKRSIPLSRLRVDLDDSGGVDVVKDVIYDRVRDQFHDVDKATLQKQADGIRQHLQTNPGAEATDLVEILAALDDLVATK